MTHWQYIEKKKETDSLCLSYFNSKERTALLMPRVRKMKKSTMQLFVAWVLSLANDVSEFILVLRALWVYNKEKWFGTPACWVLASVHGVIMAITPKMMWLENATVEAIANHYSVNAYMIGMWLLFSAIPYMVEESEAEERVRIKRTSYFLRKHGVGCRKVARETQA